MIRVNRLIRFFRKDYKIISYGVLLTIIMLEYGAFSLLRDNRHFLRTVPVTNFDHFEYRYPYETPKELKVFAGNSPIAIMQKIMNFVSENKNIKWKSEHVKDIYEAGKLGAGLNCNCMAELFLHSLRLQGYKARKLFAVKDIGNSDLTHTIVEVFENGRWIIYDPTFNVSFKKEGRLLGAIDIASSLIDGSFKKVEPVFYGEVAYPKRLEKCPAHWLIPYRNVLFYEYGNYSSSWWVRNTTHLLFRYWQGPTLYYYSHFGVENRYLALINWLYFFTMFIGPFLVLLLLAVIFIDIFWIILSVQLKFLIKIFKKGKKVRFVFSEV